VYKKGVDNKVADAMSRHPLHSAEDSVCYAVVESQPKWLDDIVDSYIGDDYAQELLVMLAVNGVVVHVPGFSLVNGLLC
jgi:hypothetical protein